MWPTIASLIGGVTTAAAALLLALRRIHPENAWILILGAAGLALGAYIPPALVYRDVLDVVGVGFWGAVWGGAFGCALNARARR